MQKRAITLFSILLLLIIPFTLAQGSGNCTPPTFSNTAQGLLSIIPSLSSTLSACPIQIPSSINSLIGKGNILITINMNSGNAENFYITLNNNQLSEITQGATTSFNYQITLSESTLNNILSSQDPLNEILLAINNKDISINAQGVWNNIKWFFGKFFIPKGNSQEITTTGKPDYCDETYLPGHQGYAENKDLWDSYSADTDKVCQSQYGKGTPSPCVHSIQLSVEGNPYYLCWYNE